MGSQIPEEQRLLVEHAVGNDAAERNDGTYNTFASESNDKTDEVHDDTSDDPGYTWKTIFMIMSTWIGVLLSSIDLSVMATLSNPITESFSSFHLLTWFINAYAIANALVQPLSGKLSDIYGRRNCLLVANFMFLLGNLLCGLATKPWHFIVGRAVGGLGGAALHSLATFLVSDWIPLRSRGLWQGLSNISFAAGFSSGGIIGGVINDAVGWRWAFLFQPPLNFLSMVLVFWLVPNSTANRDEKRPSLKQIDFLGTATLTAAIFTLMFGAISGGNTLPWTSPFVLGPLMASPFLLVLFGYIEDKVAKDPIIPVRLLKNRSVLGACLTNFLCCTANTALIYYLPMLMETQGMSPSQAGLRQIPSAFGSFAGSVAAGALMSATGKYYWLLLSALATLAGASLTLLFTLKEVSGWLSFILLFLNGTGFGGMLVTTLLALVSSVDHKQHAVMTSASYAFRTAGNIAGTTIAGAIFQNIFGQQLWTRLGNQKGAETLIPALRRKQIDLGNVPKSWLPSIVDSYDTSFQAVFVFIFATYLLGNITASIIRENRLHSTMNRK